MGAMGSTCVRTCMHSTPEYAEDLLQGSPQVPMGHGATSSSAGVAKSEGSEGISVRVLPPVPQWWSRMQEAQARSSPPETPRFDEVYTSPRMSTFSTPRDKVGGDFLSPRHTHRSGVSVPSGKASRSEEPCSSKSEEISFEGAYLGNLRHGPGRLRMSNCTYEGEFVNDIKHGNGSLHWDDGRQYCGQFACGKFSGSAIMTWPDGREYSGQYADDRKHGEGIFSWNDGRRYEGQWICGKRHGIGLYTNAKGITRQGYWQKDRPMQWDPPGTEEAHKADAACNSGPLSLSKGPSAWGGAYPPRLPEDRVVLEPCKSDRSSTRPCGWPLPPGDDGLSDPKPPGVDVVDKRTAHSEATNVANAVGPLEEAAQMDVLLPTEPRTTGTGAQVAAIEELTPRASPQPAQAWLTPVENSRAIASTRARTESAPASTDAIAPAAAAAESTAAAKAAAAPPSKETAAQHSSVDMALVDAAAKVGIEVANHSLPNRLGTEMRQNGTVCKAEANLHPNALASSSDATSTTAVQQSPQRLSETDVDLDMQARITQAAASIGIEVVRKPMLRLPAGGMQPESQNTGSCEQAPLSIMTSPL